MKTLGKGVWGVGGWGGGDVDSADFLCGAVMETGLWVRWGELGGGGKGRLLCGLSLCRALSLWSSCFGSHLRWCAFGNCCKPYFSKRNMLIRPTSHSYGFTSF